MEKSTLVAELRGPRGLATGRHHLVRGRVRSVVAFDEIVRLVSARYLVGGQVVPLFERGGYALVLFEARRSGFVARPVLSLLREGEGFRPLVLVGLVRVHLRNRLIEYLRRSDNLLRVCVVDNRTVLRLENPEFHLPGRVVVDIERLVGGFRRRLGSFLHHGDVRLFGHALHRALGRLLRFF